MFFGELVEPFLDVNCSFFVILVPKLAELVSVAEIINHPKQVIALLFDRLIGVTHEHDLFVRLEESIPVAVWNGILTRCNPDSVRVAGMAHS